MSTINLMQLSDHQLSLILNELPIKDKFKLRVICHRFNRILTNLISRINTLGLKQIHLCEWTNAKFNELNTLNLTNINQINKLLNKFNRIERLKLKLNCSHLLDYRQLNSSSTKNLKEFYLLVNCDSIYKQIIYLHIQNVESLTIFANRYDHLDIINKKISFLNHFKRLKYFCSNIRHCYAQDGHSNGEQLHINSNHQFIIKNYPFTNHQKSPNLTNGNVSDNRPISKYGVQTLQLKNHTINNLNLLHVIIDTFDHLDLVKSFTRLQKLSLLSIKEEWIEKFVYHLPYLTHLTIHHLNANFIDIEHLFNFLIQMKNLKYLNLTIHQLNFDFHLRQLLIGFLSKSRIKLVLNSFEINEPNELNKFQRFFAILPTRIKKTFNLKHLSGDELELSYCSNLVFNKIVYNQIRSLTIKKFIRTNQLRNVSNYLNNLHYLEIRDYYGDVDEMIFGLLDSNLRTNLKTLKLIKVNISNVNSLLYLIEMKNLIHLEIQLKFFMQSNAMNRGLNDLSNNDHQLNGKKNHRNIEIRHLINDESFSYELFNNYNHSSNTDLNKQVINIFYSIVKLEKIQKLILGKFRLTTTLLLHLLQNCSNLYLLNVDTCSNVDHFILQNAIRNKFALNSILNR